MANQLTVSECGASVGGRHRDTAREVLTEQAHALGAMIARIGDEFDQAVDLILRTKGRTIVLGMGKSGLVGKKIAATFSSTGTPSFFIHPGDAFHGDLGMIRPEDLVILISNSGRTDEILRMLPPLKHFGNRIIAMTGGADSPLAQNADVALDVSVEREVCPNNLAPTTSTLVTMAMGDALAVALIKARDFKPDDFAVFHPGGDIGRRLLTRVRDVMRSVDLPTVPPSHLLRDCLFTMTSSRLGLAIVMDEGRLVGVLTDGDLRRAMLQDPATLDKPVREFMNKRPVTIRASAKLVEADAMMKRRKIKVLIVTGERLESDHEDVCGVLEIYD
ncbi:MAG: SIS domain-containing protein [Thiotrichales bacterium]